MLADHALEYLALAVAVAGLAGVALEILIKDPSLFGSWIGGKVALLRRPAPVPAHRGSSGRGRTLAGEISRHAA